MLAKLGVRAVAVDVGHHAIVEMEIHSIPLGALNIGTAYTVMDAEIANTAFRAVAYSPLGNGRGNALAGFDVIDIDG